MNEQQIQKIMRNGAVKITVGLVLIVALFHMVMTVAYTFPNSDWSKQRRNTIVYSYMWPFFHQDYQLFAPNPINSERSLHFKAIIENHETGEKTETDWVDFSGAEIGSFDRKLKRKHLSIVGAEGYYSAQRALTAAQKEVIAKNFAGKEGFIDLSRELKDAGDNKNPSAVTTYMRNSNYIVSMATQVMRALYGDEGRVTAVKTRVRYTQIPRWTQRNEAEFTEKTQWKFTDYETGWRPTLTYAGQNEEVFKETIQGWFE